MTGASGAPYGLRLLECLVSSGEQVQLMISQPGQVVIAMESDLSLPARPADMARVLAERFRAEPDQLRVFGRDQWTAPVASGSSAPRAMVVCPCTTGTLSAIACGTSDQLIDRAADVVLKERRTLVLVPRETPFSEIHLENMLKLARMGAVILPPNPGFYHRPERVEDLVDFIVARILDHLDIDHELVARWGEQAP
ncbi:MAG: UbiX family flavin prenyltransferase [Gammaproteobacteria bacterium]|nr:UbiX family flavin prenyltransferase [Gammaproteobacteria bacterium]NIR97466.1 UbiX family flavin prenyltransferase [Gammaproteobacteria bacterium]NIT63091.1 UbiX family flavin prenyltransferase [Gammaproteobacteria bacterium]NIV20053.1 UbiX family flavin prenyltransferase [Gammaproteobacteria bacterium]NIX10161.1 UbiX family flavin prenyltransferase [Gammaproteobacteria bacterium]